ncbi:Ig-like domain-containing protein [Sphingomonas ginkgonis]|uniref:Ig-like domain-containing protein n=1 Tax=Sphingomonas ginkgonis TaxID=2315330 RepID=UPI00163B1DA0|nr:Ig-like domain-containing protein [Sphingomonas ginkgonis]
MATEFVGTNYNDLLLGSAYVDKLAGGNGDDQIRGGGGDDIIWGDSFSNSDANDNGSDLLYGDAGNDQLHGGNGKDYLDGGSDSDTLWGDNGTDVLFGNAGNDLLIGGQAGDFLRGGLGADTFRITTNTLGSVADSTYVAGSAGAVSWTGETTAWSKSWDVIADFSGAGGESDKIDLSQLGSFVGHALVYRSPIGTDATAGTANAALAWGVWSDAAGQFLYADTTGDGKADMKIQVSGVGKDDFIGVTQDTAPPSVVVNIVDPTLSDHDNSSIVTFTFSEYVLGFSEADIVATGGSIVAGSLSTSDGGKTWSATFVAEDGYEGTGSVAVSANSYTDYSSNLGLGGSDSVTIDTKNPTVSSIVFADPLLTDATPSTTVTVTFSEAVSGFSNSDVTATGGALSAFSSADGGKTWTATFTAADDYDSNDGLGGDGAGISIGNGFTDLFGNDGVGASQSVEIDRTNPTVTVDIANTLLNLGDNQSAVSFTFSEAVSGFDESDLTVAGGTLSGFEMVDATHYKAVFTADPGFEGSGSVSVGAGYTDLVGNAGAGGSDSVTIDTKPTSVAVELLGDTTGDDVLNIAEAGSAVTVKLTFDGAVAAFGEDDLVVTGGTLVAGSLVQDAVDPSIWTAQVVPAGPGTTSLTVAVADGNFSDDHGNAGVGASDSIGLDLVAPTVAVDIIDGALNLADNQSLVTIAFSEGVTGFDVDDLSADHGTLSGFTMIDASHYSAVFTADAGYEGNGGVSAGSGYSDLAGNGGSGGSDGVTIDTKAPVVSSIVFANGLLTDATSSTLVTITFSEAVSGFGNGDVTPTGGSLSAFSSADGGTTWTATFTATDGYDSNDGVAPDGAGISVAGTYVDAAGNSGSGGSQGVEVDRLNPTVLSIVASPTTLTDGVPTATVTVTFSEAIDTATLSMLDFSSLHGTFGGTITHVSGNSYSIQYTAADGYDGPDTLTLGNLWTDANGNAGTGSSTSVTIDRFEPPVAPTVARVEFVPSASDFASDPVNGAVGSFVAYDAANNIVSNAFTDGNYGLNGALHITAAGVLSFNANTNNYDTTFSLFGQSIHLLVGQANADSYSAGATSTIQILIGVNGGDTLGGGLNEDTIWGGNNTANGSFDVLNGGSGNDYLFGGNGNDKLTGGAGADTLSGGAGNDTFIFGANDSLPSLRDLITDFTDASDKLDLSALNLSGGLSSIALLSHGAWVHNDGANTYLDAGVSGDGVADFSIMLQGVHTLTTTNTVL